MKSILGVLFERNLKAYLVFFVSFIICLFVFGDLLISLTLLKIENERTMGVITNIDRGMRGQSLRIQYNYDFRGNTYTGRVWVSNRLFIWLHRMITFREYHIGQRINILVNSDNTFTFIEEELVLDIFRRASFILFVPFFALFITNLFSIDIRNKTKDKKTIKSNQKAYYKYYVQGKDYKIKSKRINPVDIVKCIEYNALRNDSIICCGIEKGNNFVEITFFKSEFELRIFYNGNERIEVISDESKISEIIYSNLETGNIT